VSILLISLLAQDPMEELEQIHRLMREAEQTLLGVELGRSETRQRDVIERLARLIGSIPPEARGRSTPKDRDLNGPKAGSGRSEPPRAAESPVSRFRSLPDRYGEWSTLPPKERDRMLFQSSAADLFPPEFRSMLRLYWKRIMDGMSPR